MSADQHHHDPLVAHDEEAEPGETEPALGPCLKHQNEASADVSRIVKIIGVVVGDGQRGEARVAEQEAVEARHEEVVLKKLL